MEILINNMPAALKKGTSFQFISENRAFTGADSYTLNITFPLRGCSQNMRIFGNIGRMDVSKEKVRYDCEIRDRSFCKFGTITITSITPEEVKTQFLEGRSEQNFSDNFDNIYLNEMDLGVPASTERTNVPGSAWNPYNFGCQYVALPWVNNESGNMQNQAYYIGGDREFAWSDSTTSLSFQPFLTYILKKIGEAVGYTVDVSEIQSSEYRWLLICNTLPAAWGMPGFAHAMPHWSVTEFFEELEKLMNGEFTINHRAKTISFAFTKRILSESAPVEITRVVDSYTTEISKDSDQCKYQEAANIKYKEPGHEKWKYFDCDWLINTFRHYRYSKLVDRMHVMVEEDCVIEYNTFAELYAANYNLKDSGNTNGASGRVGGSPGGTATIHYAKDIDTYFTFYTLWYEEIKNDHNRSTFRFHMCLLPINLFGERVFKKDNSNTMELNIVPAWIDYTDAVNGDIMFLECSSQESTSDAVVIQGDNMGRAYLQPSPIRVCQNGDRNKSEEYYDKLYVGFYDGHYRPNTVTFLPRPVIDAVDLRADWTYTYNANRSLRLNTNAHSAPRKQFYTINTEKKFNFSFLSDSIPDVRALFFINGRRYLCEKITCTFSENGKSSLLKGVFYEVTST